MDVKSASGKIGVVGTGVIGAGWAAYFLAKGFDVFASDPAEGAETRLRTFVDTAWPTLEQLGLAASDGEAKTRIYDFVDKRAAKALQRSVAGE